MWYRPSGDATRPHAPGRDGDEGNRQGDQQQGGSPAVFRIRSGLLPTLCRLRETRQKGSIVLKKRIAVRFGWVRVYERRGVHSLPHRPRRKAIDGFRHPPGAQVIA